MNYDGDPKLYDTGDGTDLLIESGQPVMDEGLENAVYLSLFGGASWWGNSISSSSEKLNSNFETINGRTLTNATRQAAEEYARNALAWLTTEGVAKSVTVEATIPAVGMLGLVITIEQPEQTNTVRYQINWQTMQVRAA